MEATALPTTVNTDLDIEAEVTNAILALDALRAAPAEVNVSMTNGQVALTGIVPSRMTAAEVERVARAVPGVAGVSNHLLDDGSLTLLVAHALATDPRTRSIPPGYRVICVFGHVTLVGKLAGEPTRNAAIEVCQSVSGVRSAKVVSTD
jgi:osmotically-inducible protein OsmY